MKLTVPASELAAAVGWILPAIPARPSLPILAGVLVTATDTPTPGGPVEGLTVQATDYKTHMRAHVSGAVIDEPGQVLIPGRALHAIVSNLSDSDTVHLTAGDSGQGGAELRAGRSRYRLDTLPPDEYPAGRYEHDIVAQLDSDVLRAAVARVLHAVVHPSSKTSEGIPCLLGINLRPSDDNTLILEATDRYRMAQTQVPLQGGALFTACPDARLVADLLKGLTGTVFLDPSGGTLAIGDDSRVAVVRCYATDGTGTGTFPDFTRVLFDPVWFAEFQRAEAEAALSRLLAVVGKDAPLVDITIPLGEDRDPDEDGGGLVAEFAAHSPVNGASGVEYVPFDLETLDGFNPSGLGGSIRIRFNASYLLDAFKAHGSETVAIGNHTPGQPKPSQIRGAAALVTVLMPATKNASSP